MRFKASWGFTVLLAASALVGCGQCRPMVRGQSPTASATESVPAVSATTAPVATVDVESQGPIIGSAPGYGNYTKSIKSAHGHGDFKVYTGFRDNNFGYEGGYYAGPEGYYTDHDRPYKVADGAAAGGCPACEYGRTCPNGGCQHCGCNGCQGFPKHYQTYQFKWPENPVYPPNVLPAAMVVYPYYTHKGPSDFFMK